MLPNEQQTWLLGRNPLRASLRSAPSPRVDVHTHLTGNEAHGCSRCRDAVVLFTENFRPTHSRDVTVISRSLCTAFSDRSKTTVNLCDTPRQKLSKDRCDRCFVSRDSANIRNARLATASCSKQQNLSIYMRYTTASSSPATQSPCFLQMFVTQFLQSENKKRERSPVRGFPGTAARRTVGTEWPSAGSARPESASCKVDDGSCVKADLYPNGSPRPGWGLERYWARRANRPLWTSGGI